MVIVSPIQTIIIINIDIIITQKNLRVNAIKKHSTHVVVPVNRLQSNSLTTHELSSISQFFKIQT